MVNLVVSLCYVGGLRRCLPTVDSAALCLDPLAPFLSNDVRPASASSRICRVMSPRICLAGSRWLFNPLYRLLLQNNDLFPDRCRRHLLATTCDFSATASTIFPSSDGVSEVQREHRASLTARHRQVQEEDAVDFLKYRCVIFGFCEDDLVRVGRL